ncbi:MAG: DUF669 domain-containing protein [Halieaceae bacterium]|nr:DUF669 domain-containing protein [Halieaceae bacterium]
MALLNHNAAEHPAQNDFDLIPNGWYQAVIEQDEVKESKSTATSWLELKIQITGPTQAGRYVWDRLFLWPDPAGNNPRKTESIAQGTLSSICGAIGIGGVTDSSELLNRPLMVKVGFEAGTGGYDDKNIVKGYKFLDSGIPAGAVAAQQVPAQQSAAPTGQPGWANK